MAKTYIDKLVVSKLLTGVQLGRATDKLVAVAELRLEAVPLHLRPGRVPPLHRALIQRPAELVRHHQVVLGVQDEDGAADGRQPPDGLEGYISFLDEVAQDTGKYCFGIKDTIQGLEMGAVSTLIVWENLELKRIVIKNNHSGGGRTRTT